MITERIRTDYAELVKPWVERFRLDPVLVYSIICQESAGNPWVTRMEPAWKYFHFCRANAERLGISFETETVCQCMSWGLCQVMGSVARELGYSDYLTKLVDPALAIEYGCKVLAQKFMRYGNESDAVAAYNAGSVIKTTGGMYVNQRYVDGVHQFLIQYRRMD